MTEDDWTPLEDLPRSVVLPTKSSPLSPKETPGLVLQQDRELALIQGWDDQLLRLTAQQLEDAMRWTEIPMSSKAPPKVWIELHGKKRAWQMFRAAKGAQQTKKDAPSGLDTAKSVLATMAKIREARKQGSGGGTTIINMPSPTFNYAVVEVDVVKQEREEMSSFEEEMKGRESLLDAVDYEPPRGKRSYHKHNDTGQRAFIIRRGGQTMLKYDQGADAAVVPLNPSLWTPDKEELPLYPDHISRITFEADKAICSTMALWQRSRQEWGALTTEQRAGWSRMGPPDGDARRKGMYLLLKYYLSCGEEEKGRLLKFVQDEIDGPSTPNNTGY